MEEQIIIFFGLFGPCSQIRGLMNNFSIIKNIKRKLIEPIILSHSHSEKENDIDYVVYSNIFDKNKLPITMISNDILFKLKYETVNHYVFIRSNDPIDMNGIYKLNREYYTNSIMKYYNLDLTKVKLIQNNMKQMESDKSNLIILTDFNCNNNSSFRVHKHYLKMSDMIEQLTNKYIHETFQNKPFLAVNIRRLKDNEFQYANWKKFYGFTFKDFYDTIVDICNKNNIPVQNIFLSIKPKILSLYKNDIFFDKINVFKHSTIPNNIQYYIEQNIAAKAKVLIFTNGSTYSEMIWGLSNSNIKLNIGKLKNINTNRNLCMRKIGIR